jgi:putative ech hydrogenase, subunit echF
VAGAMKFTGFALKNLFSKPATYGYPYVKKDYKERYRGRIAIDIDDCLFCGMCSRKCPSGAITVDRNARTWTIDRMGCVQCANCVEGCPKHCLHTENEYTEPDTTKTIDTFAAKPLPKKEEAATEDISEKLPKANLDECVFCGLCAKNCPADAIDVNRQEKTWKLDKDSCQHCGVCKEKCPKKCISFV